VPAPCPNKDLSTCTSLEATALQMQPRTLSCLVTVLAEEVSTFSWCNSVGPRNPVENLNMQTPKSSTLASTIRHSLRNASRHHCMTAAPAQACAQTRQARRSTFGTCTRVHHWRHRRAYWQDLARKHKQNRLISLNAFCLSSGAALRQHCASLQRSVACFAVSLELHIEARHFNALPAAI
jgi:hypothetical protein